MTKLSLILSVLAMMISCLTFVGTIYYQYYREDLSLIVFPSLSDSLNLRPANLEMAFAFSNPGNRTILIEDIKLITLIGTLSSRPHCADANVLIQYRNQSFNPSPLPGTRGLIPASSIKIGKDAVPTHTFAVGSGSTETAVAKFNIAATSWQDSTTVVTSCPVYQYAESSGKVWESICEGWSMSAILMNGNLVPRLIEPIHGSLPLLPAKMTKECATITD